MSQNIFLPAAKKRDYTGSLSVFMSSQLTVGFRGQNPKPEAVWIGRKLKFLFVQKATKALTCL